MIPSKEINSFAFPLIVTQIGQILIGQLALHFAVANSSLALSGIAIIQNLLFAFGGLLGAFSLAFNIKSARSFANQERSKFNDLLKSNLILDGIIGLAFAVFVLVFGKILLRQVYGFSGQLLDLSTAYLLLMAPYIGLTLLNFSLTSLLRVQKKTKPIMWVGLASSLLDVVLNYLFVPGFGIKGAALATILSLAFISLSYLWLVYPLVFEALASRSTSKCELIRFGMPLMGQEILESVLFIMVFDALMARLGVELLAIYAVTSQLLSIVRVPAFVYATAVSVYLPQAEKSGQVSAFLKTICKNAYAVSLVLSVLLVFLSNSLANFLSSEITQNIVPITLFTVIVMCVSPLYESTKMVLQSLEDETFVLRISILVNLLCVGAMLFLQLLQLQTYFSLYFIYGVSLAVLSLLFLRRAFVPR